MKKYKSDDQIFRDLQESIEYILAPYIGASDAEATAHNNCDLLNHLEPVSEYLGYVVRYFQFREEHSDMEDGDLFTAFEQAEKDR